jgi:hypothetical protein
MAHRVSISSRGLTMFKWPFPSCAPILTSRMMLVPISGGMGRCISFTASSSPVDRSLQIKCNSIVTAVMTEWLVFDLAHDVGAHQWRNGPLHQLYSKQHASRAVPASCKP